MGGTANQAPCTQVVIVRQIRWADAVRLTIDRENQFFFNSGAVDPAFVQRLNFKRHLVDRTAEAEGQRFILILVTQPIAGQSSGCVAGPGRGRHRARAAADRDHGAVGQRLGGVGCGEGLCAALGDAFGSRHQHARTTDPHRRVVAALDQDVQIGGACAGGVGEHIAHRVGRALQTLHGGVGVVQHIAVGAVGVQRQSAISARERTAHRTGRVGAVLDGGDHQACAIVIGQHAVGGAGHRERAAAGGVVGVGDATTGFHHGGRVAAWRFGPLVDRVGVGCIDHGTAVHDLGFVAVLLAGCQTRVLVLPVGTGGRHVGRDLHRGACGHIGAEQAQHLRAFEFLAERALDQWRDIGRGAAEAERLLATAVTAAGAAASGRRFQVTHCDGAAGQRLIVSAAHLVRGVHRGDATAHQHLHTAERRVGVDAVGDAAHQARGRGARSPVARRNAVVPLR